MRVAEREEEDARVAEREEEGMRVAEREEEGMRVAEREEEDARVAEREEEDARVAELEEGDERVAERDEVDKRVAERDEEIKRVAEGEEDRVVEREEEEEERVVEGEEEKESDKGHDEGLSAEADRESGYRREVKLQPRSGIKWELLTESRLQAGGEAELPVLFPGHVSPESCCRLVCELLKHVLYQRQQLPLPYQQLAFFSRSDSGMVSKTTPGIL
ncbi:hypothetical protein scyTo_0025658 [Scyliorhinus torazame]|uniref:Uncharacterized protein n=1 Tax=Scyliorhinus torazame TaxID=75743 RepID=A0A401QI07_SCYTO|nr:hypothetical protein [Scyliorhinus torazame]